MYGSIIVGNQTVSHCMNDCSGRIGVTASDSDGNYFCGDGLVQYKNGTSCAGDHCSKVTESNYPGVEIGAFTASEKCDPAANDSPQTICEQALGTGHTYYPQNAANYAATGATIPSCADGCQSFNNADKNTGCNYCGDDKIGGNEECDGTDTSCAGVTKTYYGFKEITWDFSSETRPAEITEANNYIYRIDVNYSGSSNYGLYYHIDGDDDPTVFYDYYSYQNNGAADKTYPNFPYYDYTSGMSCTNCPGWKREQIGGKWAYCSDTVGRDKSMADLVLTLVSTGGTLSFDYYGESQSYNYPDDGCRHTMNNSYGYMYDGLVFHLDRDSTYNGSPYGNTDWYASGKCSSWTTKSFDVNGGPHKLIFRYFKNGSSKKGMDKFCITNIKFRTIAPQDSDPSEVSCNSECKKTCKLYSYCGDGTTDALETCDSGSGYNNDNYDTNSTNPHCNSNCTGLAPHCGDGTKNGNETCDGSAPAYCYLYEQDGTDCDGYPTYSYSLYYLSCSTSCKYVKGSKYDSGYGSGITSSYPQCPQ